MAGECSTCHYTYGEVIYFRGPLPANQAPAVRYLYGSLNSNQVDVCGGKICLKFYFFGCKISSHEGNDVGVYMFCMNSAMSFIFRLYLQYLFRI